METALPFLRPPRGPRKKNGNKREQAPPYKEAPPFLTSRLGERGRPHPLYSTTTFSTGVKGKGKRTDDRTQATSLSVTREGEKEEFFFLLSGRRRGKGSSAVLQKPPFSSIDRSKCTKKKKEDSLLIKGSFLALPALDPPRGGLKEKTNVPYRKENWTECNESPMSTTIPTLEEEGRRGKGLRRRKSCSDRISPLISPLSGGQHRQP